MSVLLLGLTGGRSCSPSFQIAAAGVWACFLFCFSELTFSSLVDACFLCWRLLKQLGHVARTGPTSPSCVPLTPFAPAAPISTAPGTFQIPSARSFSPAWNSLPLDLIRFTILLDSASSLCPSTISFQKPFLLTPLRRAAPSRHSPFLYPASLLKLLTTSQCQTHTDLLNFSSLCPPPPHLKEEFHKERHLMLHTVLCPRG